MNRYAAPISRRRRDASRRLRGRALTPPEATTASLPREEAVNLLRRLGQSLLNGLALERLRDLEGEHLVDLRPLRRRRARPRGGDLLQERRVVGMDLDQPL